ncbi:MAG TPA: pilus assembly PilX N-terminal domain-containing protein [Gemmatimonadales bacterium]|nr:pilus assembly PilX N-terminal domain-containing protein [Gemmatimonadales bacterium]
MKQVLHNERGMALAIAIVALVVVGALIAGAFFSGTQEQRVAENERRVQASFGVAEQGVYDVIRGWSAPAAKATYNGLYPYPAKGPSKDTVLIGKRTATSKTGSYSGTLFKLNDELFLIDVSAQDTVSLAGRIRGGGASQRLGLLARIRPLAINTQAAVTSGGSNVVVGSASVDGYDHVPTGWAGCPPLDSAKAGIRTQSDGTVSTSGHPTLLGNPPVLKDPTLADSSFSIYGDVKYTDLAASASVTLPAQNFSNSIGPAILNGACNTGVLTNWGSPTAPTGPCGSYFPIIHITGTGSVINGQEGQGVLLVDGSLDVQGGFQFYGVVIIKGSLKTSGGGSTPAHFWGTVMVQDTAAFTDTTNNISGGANLMYSKCAILKALNKTGVGSMMRSRGWVQLF